MSIAEQNVLSLKVNGEEIGIRSMQPTEMSLLFERDEARLVELMETPAVFRQWCIEQGKKPVGVPSNDRQCPVATWCASLGLHVMVKPEYLYLLGIRYTQLSGIPWTLILLPNWLQSFVSEVDQMELDKLKSPYPDKVQITGTQALAILGKIA